MDVSPWGPRDRVRLDAQGRVRTVIHGDAVVFASNAPVVIAATYLVERAEAFGLTPAELATLGSACPGAYSAPEPLRLHLERESPHAHGTTLAFVSGRHGLPCTQGGMVVQFHPASGNSIAVAAAARIAPPATSDLPTTEQVEAALDDPEGVIQQALGPLPAYFKRKYFTLLGHRLAVAPAPRWLSPEGPSADLEFPWNVLGKHWKPSKLAEVVLDATIQTENIPLTGRIFRVQVAVRSGQLWGLEAGDSGVKGSCFAFDPLSGTGITGLVLSSSDAALAAATGLVELNLTPTVPPNKQELLGPQVERVQLVGDPAPPTAASGADFVATPRSTDFGWIGAHYHVDHALAQLASVGLDQPTMFPKQPATVDSWPLMVRLQGSGLPGTTSPKANTTAGYDGATYITFGPLDTTGGPALTLYGSADGRIAWHELCGHVTLLNHLDSPNLRFAHSFGDGLAAVYAHALTGFDTLDTFPWSKTSPGMDRSHKREPAGGYGWGSHTAPTPVDYVSEERLSSTLYRLYRSLGGDGGSTTARLGAAQVVAWLAGGGVCGLTAANSPVSAEDFESRMEVIDALAWPAKGYSGGAYHKVVRWAFEKQGCFQIPDSNDYTQVGSPPPTDIFVQDGRNGEYTYSTNWWWKGRVWNRLAPDGLQTHQKPVAGQINYIYARVGNRGSVAATSVTLRGWFGSLVIGAEFPTHYTAIPSPSAGFSVNAGELVGITSAPIPWTPPLSKNYSLLVAAQHSNDGDNTPSFSAAAPVAISRLVPHDNNLGVRHPWIILLVPVAVKFRFAEALALALHPPADGKLALRFSVKAPFSSHFSSSRAQAIGLTTLTLGVTCGQTVSIPVDPPPFARPSWMLAPCQLKVEAYLDGVLVGGSVGLLQI